MTTAAGGIATVGLVVRDEMPEPDEAGFVTVKAQAIREVVDPDDQQQDIDAAVSYVYGEPMVDKDRIGIWGTSFGGGHVIYPGGARSSHRLRGRPGRQHAR